VEELILKKIDEMKERILKNIDNYDLNLILDLLNNLNSEISYCIKLNPDILEFFKNKKNFRTIADLKKFGNDKLNYSVKKTKRADIEKELARFIYQNNIQVDRLWKLLGKEKEQKVIKKSAIQKPKSTYKPKKKKIEDKTAEWMGLTIEELKIELNDLNKYPDSTTLKHAAYSILLPSERRLRKREKIINIIIKRISEDKAMVKLGR